MERIFYFRMFAISPHNFFNPPPPEEEGRYTRYTGYPKSHVLGGVFFVRLFLFLVILGFELRTSVALELFCQPLGVPFLGRIPVACTGKQSFLVLAPCEELGCGEPVLRRVVL
jgi:hypothetical protein